MNDHTGSSSTNHLDDAQKLRDFESMVAWEEATRQHWHSPEDDEPLPWPPEGFVVCPRCGDGLLILRRTVETQYWANPECFWDPAASLRRGGVRQRDVAVCNNPACRAEWREPRWNAQLSIELDPLPVGAGPICYDHRHTPPRILLLQRYLHLHAPQSHRQWLDAWPAVAERLTNINVFASSSMLEDVNEDVVRQAEEDLVQRLAAITPAGLRFGVWVDQGHRAWGYWPIEEDQDAE